MVLRTTFRILWTEIGLRNRNPLFLCLVSSSGKRDLCTCQWAHSHFRFNLKHISTNLVPEVFDTFPFFPFLRASFPQTSFPRNDPLSLHFEAAVRAVVRSPGKAAPLPPRWTKILRTFTWRPEEICCAEALHPLPFLKCYM